MSLANIMVKESLSEQLLQLHLKVLKYLVQGKSFKDISTHLENEFERLNYLEIAKKAGWLSFNEKGELIGAYPVSPKKTPWRVHVEGIGTGHAMCAIDALGMAYTFGRKTRIETIDQTTKQSLVITIDPEVEDDWNEFKDYYVTYKKFENINEARRNAAVNQCPFIHVHSSLSSVPQDASIEILPFTDALAHAKRRFSPEGFLRCLTDNDCVEEMDAGRMRNHDR